MDEIRTTVQPFALHPSAESAWARAALGVAVPAVERLLGLSTLGRMYTEATGSAVVDDFPERALDHLGIPWHVSGAAMSAIPRTGPLVIVANHPFGAADGLVLLAALRTVRRDVRLLGNYLLERIPELADLIIALDPFGGQDSGPTNRRMLRRAVDWTGRGGATIVFPAGEVSAHPAPGGRLIDGPWKRGVARLVSASGATVLPVYFEGRNSTMFELAGRVNARLRTALLPRELLARRGRPVAPVIGAPIPPEHLAGRSDEALVRYLRARTFGLRGVDLPSAGAAHAPGHALPVVPAKPIAAVAAEVEALPGDRLLATHRDLRVYYATAAECPSVVDELARLREITFRAAGEGTGRERDLDRFDAHYWHLFVWHADRHEIVGAYRLGATDRISGRFGRRGLYTRTLFRYGRPFLDALGPALELGRSFVRQEYQRDFSALLLLWQGIGGFVVRHPQYRRLFGPVTISANYRPASRDLLVSALAEAARISPYAGLASARRPHRSLTGARVTDLVNGADSAHAVVAELEPDGRGLPVLLRQYLRLGATPVAMSIDPDFSHSVDALMVVDLDRVGRATLNRYMGESGAARFISSRES